MSFPHLTRLLAQLSLMSEDEAESSGPAGDSVPWRELKGFLAMTETALRVRAETVTNLQAELEASRGPERGSDEIEFLEGQILALNADRNALQQRVQELTRAKQCLEQEVTIMRAQAAAAAEAASPLPPVAVSPLAAELTAEHAALRDDLRTLKSKLDSIKDRASSAAESPRISSARRYSVDSKDSVTTP